MKTQLSLRLAFVAALAAIPIVGGCDVDNHATATGQVKSKNLTPNEGGPGGSGSIASDKSNSGGPGAPGTTARNPEK